MRPLRFVALSEDGQALILTDEVGRMLFLSLDESVITAVRHDQARAGQLAIDVDASLTPRDIQARIRAGDSVAEVARVANVPVEKVLRFAGPVLQERAAMAELARRTRLRGDEKNRSVGEVADSRLTDHGVDPQMVSWDAFRRENATWRICASWQSGKATARAMWDLDKARSVATPSDDMANFLSSQRKKEQHPQEGDLSRSAVPQAKTFTDDEAEGSTKEGPVVPAVSMLRRDRPFRQSRSTERTGLTHPSEGQRTEPAAAVPGLAGHAVAGSSSATNHPYLPYEAEAASASSYSDDMQSAEAEPMQRVSSGGGGSSAAEALGLTNPNKPRKRALPSWDDILFGSRSE